MSKQGVTYSVEDVMTFIKSFSGIQTSFTTGLCYWFSVVLFHRFGHACSACKIMYNPTENHFATQIDGVLYDAIGIISEDISLYVPWLTFCVTNPTESSRVRKYSIMLEK